MNEKKEKLYNVLVDFETRRKLKVRAAQRSKTIGELIKELIEAPYIPKSSPGEQHRE